MLLLKGIFDSIFSPGAPPVRASVSAHQEFCLDDGLLSATAALCTPRSTWKLLGCGVGKLGGWAEECMHFCDGLTGA